MLTISEDHCSDCANSSCGTGQGLVHYLEPLLGCELLLFCMSLLQLLQLLLWLMADLADVGVVLLSLLQLHLHLGQLLLEVVQLHTNGLPPCFGMLQHRSQNLWQM